MKTMTFNSDELFLALIGLVRATRPAMLRQEADGFSVDFQAIASSKTPGPADRLLLKIGALMENSAEAPPGHSNEAPADNGSRSLDLDAAEARQIADALAKLERLQAWPRDVMDLSRALRTRLASEPGADSGGAR
jgi:hypothetical protein